jgi:hypothetical protein
VEEITQAELEDKFRDEKKKKDAYSSQTKDEELMINVTRGLCTGVSETNTHRDNKKREV